MIKFSLAIDVIKNLVMTVFIAKIMEKRLNIFVQVVSLSKKKGTQEGNPGSLRPSCLDGDGS